jgi:hypothetical protein
MSAKRRVRWVRGKGCCGMIEHVARGFGRGVDVRIAEFDDESLVLNVTIDLDARHVTQLSFTDDVETQLVPLALAKARALDACERLRAAAEVFRASTKRQAASFAADEAAYERDVERAREAGRREMKRRKAAAARKRARS